MRIVYTDGKALIVYKGSIIACCGSKDEANKKMINLIIKMGL